MSDVTFNFLIPADSDAQLDELCRKEIDRDWAQFNEGAYCWPLQTYLVLKARGLPVVCSRRTRSDCINLGHAVLLSTLKPEANVFLVCMQADYPRHGWAQAHIVQNQLQARPDAYWIMMWSQPGLIARDPSRRGVQSVAFAGRPYYLAEGFDAWRNDFTKLGLSFRILDAHNWNDYAGVDILLAIRSFDRRTWPAKPASKLINAWNAGIPLIAGFDSAYTRIGEPGQNYLRVSTKQETLDAVRSLQSDPALYDRLVTAGHARAVEFTRAKLAEQWEQLLTGPLTARFNAWQARGPADRFAWRCRAACGLGVRGARYAASRLFKRWVPFP